MLRNNFFLKHLSMATGNLNLLWPSKVMSANGSKIQNIPKKERSESFIEYFTYSKNGVAKYLSTQNFCPQL